MTIKCKVHNRGPGAEVFFDAGGKTVTVAGGETVEATVSEAMFTTLKSAFDDPKYRLDLVSADVGGEKDGKVDATDLIGSTKTADDLKSDRETLGAQHPPESDDTIEKLLADADKGNLTYSQLRSRAKELLGNDFPVGTSPKKDEIVQLLTDAQKKRAQP